jgi:hypothetical protein
MRMRFWIILALAASLRAAVPTPKEHLGFTPGDEKKLADYSQITSYFQKLEKASDRLVLKQFGRTSTGKPMYLAIISAPENLKRLEHYRSINHRLALGTASGDEAKRLAAEGKVIVWIDSGLHASEVAPAQQAPDLAYRMLTGEDEETRRIRQNVILLQIPCINPDGLDWIVEWYRYNVGTPHELAPMPRLYQKYAGHDNNRDYFMLNLEETRHVSKLLFQEWFPEIVYNQHQQPAFPARIFIPPYAEPLNPNIPAPVMEGVNVIGSAMSERLARAAQRARVSQHARHSHRNRGRRLRHAAGLQTQRHSRALRQRHPHARAQHLLPAPVDGRPLERAGCDRLHADGRLRDPRPGFGALILLPLQSLGTGSRVDRRGPQGQALRLCRADGPARPLDRRRDAAASSDGRRRGAARARRVQGRR